MKPVLLKIKGLNSFLQEQIIDFTRLSKFGFFGIFGPTGSGKSSIIDAITLALYGEVSRFDGNSKTSQFININSELTYVYFEFAIQEKIYIVERQYKFKNKNLSNTMGRLSLKYGSDIGLPEDKVSKITPKIIEIIGATYEDFKRTIILPQGKFSEFLLLKSEPRRKMLERIFNLEKYGEDFRKKFNQSEKENLNLLGNIESQLKIYESVSQEELDKLINENFAASQNINRISEDLEKDRNLLIKLNEYQKSSRELNEYNKKRQELSSQIEYINEIKTKANIAKNAQKLKPTIEKYKNQNKTLSEKKFKHVELKEKYDKILKSEDELQLKLESIKKDKETKIPFLENELRELKSIIEISEALRILEIERDKLREEFKDKKTIQDNFIKFFEELKNSEKKLRDQLKQILYEKNENYFAPEYRDDVTNGFNITNEIIRLNKEKQLLTEKKITCEKALIEMISRLEAGESRIINEKLKLESINNELEQCSKTDINKLSELSQKIIDLTNEFKYKENLFKTKSDLNKKITKIENEINKLEIAKRNFDSTKLIEELQEIEKVISNSDFEKALYIIKQNLNKGDTCPICGSELTEISSNNEFHDSSSDEIQLLIKRKSEIEEKIKDLESELNKINITSKLKIEERDNLRKEADLIEISENEIEILENELKSQNLEHEKMKNEFETNAKTLKKLNCEKEILLDLLNKIEMDKAQNLANIENKKKEQIEINNNLTENDNSINSKKTEISEILIDVDFKEEYEKIKKSDIILAGLYKNEKKINKELDALELKIMEAEKQKQKIDSEFEEVKNKGIEKNSLISAKAEELNKLPKYTDPKAKFLESENEKNKILDSEIKTAEKMKLISDNKQNLQNEISALKGEIKSTQTQMDEYKTELEKGLKEYNFADIEEAEKSCLPEENIFEFEDKINNYNDELKLNNENISRTEKILEGVELNDLDGRILSLDSKIKEMDGIFLKLKEDAAVLNSKIEKMQKDLVFVNKLNQEKAEINHQIDIYKDLAEVFRSNKFVEYLAKKQLKYITAEASARLKRMTKGRYAIELDETFDNAEFIIRDDFNGGVRRTPLTLSGGETFIVSLCLALALSSKIQLKNKSPLEFFFLDEGFGTLDKKSLEVVVECLISLRSEKLTVGVISHSEELKEYVEIKLLVESPKQFEHGSLVKIEA